MKLDEKRLYDILRELGLSKKQADIYMFLSRRGPQKANTVATHLNIDRAQIYRSLKILQEKGILELTIEAPTRYIAVPIEPLIESYIKGKKNEVTSLEVEKTELINYFKSISTKEQEYPMAKFQIITGKNGIYTKISQMVTQSRKEILSLTTSAGLIQEDIAGVQDTIIETARKKETRNSKCW